MTVVSLLLLAAGALAGGDTGPVLGWTPMVWASVRIGGRDVPHAALMVEVSVNGLPSPALRHLDTGAINWVYRKPGDAPHERFWRGNSSVSLDGNVAGRPFTTNGSTGGKGSGPRRWASPWWARSAHRFSRIAF
ncbi:MAG TPA: hypothetical protein VKB88_15385 [Bryobacteraceae bacterium]|nr:hypothetical protein [Bryobacteraceae bacterium]